MSFMPTYRRARRASFLVPFLTVAFAALALVGCDAATGDGDDGDGPSGGNILGLWQNVETDTAGNETLREFWVDFAEDEIITYDFEEAEDGDVAEDCFERDEIEVVSIDGDRWSIRNVEADSTVYESTFTVQRDGDYLVLSDEYVDEDGETETDEERYRRSTRTDFTPLCD